MWTMRRNTCNEACCLLVALVVLKSVSGAPTLGARSLSLSSPGYARNQGLVAQLLRRQARHYIEPYWLNPCGDVTASKTDNRGAAVNNKVDTVDASSFKHHYQAIRNYAEALYKQVSALKTKEEGGDPYLHSQDYQFDLTSFPKTPDSYQDRLALTTVESALRETYRLLQLAAVYISSTEMDEANFEGPFIDDLDDIQRGPNGLQVLMCSVRMAMAQTGVNPNYAVEQELKKVDITPIRDSSRRNLRDILRLHGTAKILNYIFETFGHLHQRAG
ncbi:hypothetical protein BV898_01571 [Hypsibius exemplaris]|uniref:Uncharacterized protein n=1 Tax=Hypsibius exemplaris TaxID=2072580 RepID=A0A1W0XAF0_HYPEX|nr:hypothetical protein BV898_01571 [Hypsibius exemplaris]